MTIIVKFFLVLVVFVSITAMSRTPSDDGKRAATDTPVKTVHDHAAKRTVKPHANINLDYELPKQLTLDVPVTINFTVINGLDADDVKVRFNVDNGLILNTVDTEISFGAASARSSHAFQLQVTPQQNGLYYINLFASMLIDNKYQTRSFAIPLSVGEYDLQKQRKPVGVISEDAGGQRVISMPAVESTDH